MLERDLHAVDQHDAPALGGFERRDTQPRAVERDGDRREFARLVRRGDRQRLACRLGQIVQSTLEHLVERGPGRQRTVGDVVVEQGRDLHERQRVAHRHLEQAPHLVVADGTILAPAQQRT
jgi:hypothetical protein